MAQPVVALKNKKIKKENEYTRIQSGITQATA